MLSRFNNGIVWVIILAVAFGLAGGIVGELVARAYIFENTFGIPFFGDLDLSHSSNGGSSIIIRDAKKVVVEQDVKVEETSAAVARSIVGIFKKKATTTLDQQKGADNAASQLVRNSYSTSDLLAAGFIITSDGWLITDFIAPEFAALSGKSDQAAEAKLFSQYVVISKNKTIYPVLDVVIDPVLPFSYWQIKALDLPVRGFAKREDMHNGQSAIAVNWQGWISIESIVGRKQNGASLVQSSEVLAEEIILTQAPMPAFRGAYLFNLNGDLMGLIDRSGKVNSISNFNSAIASLLKNKEISKPYLGINYLDLASLYNADKELPGQGALIYPDEQGVAIAKDSPAAIAGLAIGDIIVTIDNIELNQDNDLSGIIATHIAGDEITVNYLRSQSSRGVKIKLGELK